MFRRLPLRCFLPAHRGHHRSAPDSTRGTRHRQRRRIRGDFSGTHPVSGFSVREVENPVRNRGIPRPIIKSGRAQLPVTQLSPKRARAPPLRSQGSSPRARWTGRTGGISSNGLQTAPAIDGAMLEFDSGARSLGGRPRKPFTGPGPAKPLAGGQAGWSRGGHLGRAREKLARADARRRAKSKEKEFARP